MYKFNKVIDIEYKLKENKFNFIVALYMAGYTPYTINKNINNDSKLLNMAVSMYNDLWDSFDVGNFERQLERG